MANLTIYHNPKGSSALGTVTVATSTQIQIIAGTLIRRM